MCSSLPKVIAPNYSFLQAAEAPAGSPDVGSAIKDLSDGAETSMKKAHDVAVAKLKDRFVSDSERYNKSYENAALRATEAKKLIGQEQRKKALIITALVATILGIVGAVIATAVTGTLPILVIAAPFVLGLVPASYYTHIFRKSVASLEDAIAAPGRLVVPSLVLPEYIAARDLELKSSRVRAQNAMASKTTLQQVVQTQYTSDEITSYALLDKMTRITANKRPPFYAKCIQLINTYAAVAQEKQGYLASAGREYSRITQDLSEWKAREDVDIARQESALLGREITAPRDPRRPVAVISHQVVNTVSRVNLEQRKRDLDRTYSNRVYDNRNWYEQTTQNINSTYDTAVSFLETQFSNAKAAAAV